MSDRPDLSALKIDDRARRAAPRAQRRLLIAALVAIPLLVLALYGFLRERTPEVPVTAVRADKGARPTLLNASGYVTPRRRATVAAKITARVNEIFADEGNRLEAAQILARLDQPD